jgi:hypothetical protein
MELPLRGISSGAEDLPFESFHQFGDGAAAGSGEECELNAGGLELGGEGHQLGGVAGEALELVDGEDGLLVGGGPLDVVRQLECLLQLRPRLHPRGDLLGEDALAVGEGERVELALEFLLRGRAAAKPVRIGLAAAAGW